MQIIQSTYFVWKQNLYNIHTRSASAQILKTQFPYVGLHGVGGGVKLDSPSSLAESISPLEILYAIIP